MEQNCSSHDQEDGAWGSTILFKRMHTLGPHFSIVPQAGDQDINTWALGGCLYKVKASSNYIGLLPTHLTSLSPDFSGTGKIIYTIAIIISILYATL
jgi:hypothetical protein